MKDIIVVIQVIFIVLVLFVISLFIGIFKESAGFIIYENDYKFYDVTTSKTELYNYVKQLNIKYVCPSHFLIILYKSKCVFAKDFVIDNDTFDFTKIMDDEVNKLGLQEKMSWTDKYGNFIITTLIILCIAMGIYMNYLEYI